uniref:Uncharacterized protein n=1 Tax=Parascaris equorum TaxID=6256 RepID=A0A914RHC4_PAREQ
MCRRIEFFNQSKTKSRTPLYRNSILSSSITYDKSDLLTKQHTLYSASEFSASTVSTSEDTNHYRLMAPIADQEQIYERPISAGQVLTSQNSLQFTSDSLVKTGGEGIVVAAGGTGQYS